MAITINPIGIKPSNDDIGCWKFLYNGSNFLLARNCTFKQACTSARKHYSLLLGTDYAQIEVEKEVIKQCRN